MAGNSVIGALRVDLGLNSAQFTSGLKSAESGLARFGKAAGLGLAAVGVAAAAAGYAMGVAVKHAIDHADALGKSAQKAGVAVEALSRLEYAAKQSDISLETLTSSLAKLGKGMAEAAGGKGPAAAFAALGIAVKDGLGNLRSSDQVFADVADRFSRMEDGALKTALAVAIFGKSGAELIPLLNLGRDGLRQMADESDRLGATISTRTSKAAEAFNDTLTKIGAIMGGVVNQVMEAALPALQSLADLLASPDFATAAATLATNIINGINAIIRAVSAAINLIQRLKDMMPKPVRDPVTGEMLGSNNVSWAPGQGPGTGGPSSPLDYPGLINFDNLFSPATGQTFGSPGAMWKSMKPGSFDASGFLGGTAKALEPVDLGITTLTEHVTTLAETMAGTVTDAFTGFVDSIMAGVSPLKAFASELANIGKQLLHAGIQSLISNIFGVGGVGSGFSGNFSIGGMPLYASGTDYHPGGLAIVGERGPELVNMPRGSSVIPAGAWGGGGTSVVRVELGPGLVGQILKQSADQAVEIVKTNAPAAVARANYNRQRG